MSFYFPLGLLGLIGIPIIIIIYIIKSKYTEQTIASTYLWELSEKFLKKRKPISKLQGIISLILQLLAVVVASFLIAHPVFTVRASANDIYFILDGSASMNMQQGGSTRFEKAQEKIKEIIDGSRSGSTYSLVFVRDTAEVAFEAVTDKEQAKINVGNLDAGWGVAECASALGIAQSYFDENPSAIIYIVSDKPYETKNMTLIDVSGGENNYALKCEPLGKGNTVKGSAVSYNSDATLTVEFAYSTARGEAYEKIEETNLQVTKGQPAEFQFETPAQFYSLRVSIVNGDALQADNSVVLYKKADAQSRKVIIVSDIKDRIYIRNAIVAAGGVDADNVKMIPTEVYTDQCKTNQIEKAELYVFNGYSPEVLPKNTAIWLIDGIDGSNADTGVSFRNYEEPRDTTGPDSYYVSEFIKPTTADEKELMKQIAFNEVTVRKYAKYNIPRSRFTTLMKVGTDPVVSAGVNKNNDRQVVIAFQIGDSDFGMSPDFLILTRNLMDYSLPSVINESIYECGEIMAVNVVPNCESIVVTSPSGERTTLDTLDTNVCHVQLTETGTYNITVKRTDREDETISSFAYVPEEESRSEGGGILFLSGEREYKYSDGFYDKLLAFFIVIGVLLLADWGIYCYEQHQLR